MATVERRRRVDVCDVDELRVVAQGMAGLLCMCDFTQLYVCDMTHSYV